jgi:hypothetical protein
MIIMVIITDDLCCLSNRHAPDANGHCNIIPLNLYLYPILIVGYVPKLKPHNIIYSVGIFNHFIIYYKSLHNDYYDVFYIVEIP